MTARLPKTLRIHGVSTKVSILQGKSALLTVSEAEAIRRIEEWPLREADLAAMTMARDTWRAGQERCLIALRQTVDERDALRKELNGLRANNNEGATS